MKTALSAVTGDPDDSGASHTLAYCLHGSTFGDQDLYVMINAYWHPVVFAVQEGKAEQWRKVIDTSVTATACDKSIGIVDVPDVPDLLPISSLSCTVDERSIVVLVRDTKEGASNSHATTVGADPAVPIPPLHNEETVPSK